MIKNKDKYKTLLLNEIINDNNLTQKEYADVLKIDIKNMPILLKELAGENYITFKNKKIIVLDYVNDFLNNFNKEKVGK